MYSYIWYWIWNCSDWTPVLWITLALTVKSAPCVSQVFLCVGDGCTDNDTNLLHYNHIALAFLTGFLFATHLPERLAPGSFDFIGATDPTRRKKIMSSCRLNLQRMIKPPLVSFGSLLLVWISQLTISCVGSLSAAAGDSLQWKRVKNPPDTCQVWQIRRNNSGSVVYRWFHCPRVAKMNIYLCSLLVFSLLEEISLTIYWTSSTIFIFYF